MRRILALLFVLLAGPALAANVNIDALPAAASMGGTDLLECEQAGVNRKCTAVQTAAYIYGLMSGDATAAAGGATTLATVNANVGTFGSSTQCTVITVNAKGLITAASQTACAGGGGGAPGGSDSNVQYNNGGVFGGTTLHPGYIANNWYTPTNMNGTIGSGAAAVANRVVCTYGEVLSKITIGALGTRINTTSAAGNIQLAVYQSSAGRPGVLVGSTASISTTTAGPFSSSITSAQVGLGSANGAQLWFCLNSDNSTVVVTGVTTLGTATSSKIGSATLVNVVSNSFVITGVACTGANCTGGSSTFNTWPATLVGSTFADVIASTAPTIGFQVTSVP